MVERGVGSERVAGVVVDVLDVDANGVGIVAQQAGEFGGDVEELCGEVLGGDEDGGRAVGPLGRREDGMCGVEGPVDGEQGGVGEGDDEQLRSRVDIVKGGARDALSRGRS